mgnify:CR=1 FL=1
MTTMQVVGAASGCEVAWHGIDWAEAHQTVRRLRMRIAKAVREGRWSRVKISAMAPDTLVLWQSSCCETSH